VTIKEVIMAAGAANMVEHLVSRRPGVHPLIRSNKGVYGQ
jgi:hypothetical protein